MDVLSVDVLSVDVLSVKVLFACIPPLPPMRGLTLSDALFFGAPRLQ